MLHKDTAEMEAKLLHELIEGCIEAEGYEVFKYSDSSYKIKTKQGNQLHLYISIKGA